MGKNWLRVALFEKQSILYLVGLKFARDLKKPSKPYKIIGLLNYSAS